MGNKKESGFGLGDLVDIGLGVTNPTALVAKKVVEKGIELYNEKQEPEEDPFLEIYNEGVNLYNEGKYDDARNNFTIAMQSKDNDLTQKAVEKYTDSTKEWYQQMEEENLGFVNNDFTDRQFILIVRDTNHIAGCYDSDGVIKWAFTMSDYPKDIKFSTGRPEPNTVYAAHPVQDGLYLPFNKFEETVFTEKVNELCRLAQALGATEITFRSIKGRSVDEASDYNWGASADGEYKGIGGSADYRQKGNSHYSAEGRSSHERVQRFAPTDSPYCPDDLLWFDLDTTWQAMAKQRIEGNILHYSLKISSTEACSMSESTSHDVNASFDAMVAKGSAHFDCAENNSSSESKETIWEVSIDFENKNKLKPAVKPIDMPFSMVIEDVFEVQHGPVVTGCVKTGIINDGEKIQIVGKGINRIVTVKGIEMFKKLLDRAETGDSCGILLDGIECSELMPGMTLQALKSEVEPQEQISQQCDSEPEAKYLQALKECITDGKIDPDDRRMLNKIRENLGLSLIRAAELEEALTTPQLTKDEQDYVNEYKSRVADGELSDKSRRLLRIMREAAGISEERAKELEKM